MKREFESDLGTLERETLTRMILLGSQRQGQAHLRDSAGAQEMVNLTSSRAQRESDRHLHDEPTATTCHQLQLRVSRRRRRPKDLGQGGILRVTLQSSLRTRHNTRGRDDKNHKEVTLADPPAPAHRGLWQQRLRQYNFTHNRAAMCHLRTKNVVLTAQQSWPKHHNLGFNHKAGAAP